METSTQQSSWLSCFGLIEAPVTEPKVSNAKRHGNCFIEDKYKETRQLKADILDKLKHGVAGRGNVFKALLSEGKIPEKNGNAMNIDTFSEHYRFVKKKFGVDIAAMPKGELRKRIVDLFDSGVSESDISKVHGFYRTHVYSTLIMCGRIKKRDRAHRLESGSVKIGRINELLKTSGDVSAIAEKTGTSRKYVRQLKLARTRTISLLNNGKSIDEICEAVEISRVHAEAIAKEVRNDTASTRLV